MSYVVTGALGNVGSAVIQALRAENVEIIAADIDVIKIRERYGASVKAVYFDFEKPETFAEVLNNATGIFLMRPPHLGNPESLFPFLDAIQAKKVNLLVFLSLMGVEHNPIPPHHKIEKAIEARKIPFAHIRPGFFMQNLSGVHAQEIREANQIFVPAGRSLTSFIDADDIGLAIATLLVNASEYYNTTHTLTGPEALNYQQIASILTEVLGRTITYAKPSLLRYRKTYISKRKLPKAYVNVTVMLYIMTRLGTAKAVTNEFELLTGKKPTTFREFARKNKKSWQK